MALIEEAIRAGIDAALVEVHTALPCRVVSYDATEQTVTVQPSIKRVFVDDGEKTIPVLTGVRVGFIRTSQHAVTFPIAKGDEGLLIFNERDISAWRKSGDTLAPSSSRKHSYSDALFIPQMYSDPNKLSNVSATDLEIRTADGTGKISIAADGKMEFEKSGDKVLQTVSDTLDKLSQTTVTITSGSSAGVWPIDQQSDFATLKTVIDNIKK